MNLFYIKYELNGMVRVAGGPYLSDVAAKEAAFEQLIEYLNQVDKWWISDESSTTSL